MMEPGHEPQLDALDADALEGSGVVTVRLPRRAIRALDAIQALTGEAISWTGVRREICDQALARSPREPYSYKTCGEALADLKRAGLLHIVKQGRNVVYYTRTTAPDGTPFAIVDADRPTGRDVVRAAGSGRSEHFGVASDDGGALLDDGGSAATNAATNAAIDSSAAPGDLVSPTRSISSSSSSGAAATNAATIAPSAATAAAIGTDATAIDPAALNEAIRRQQTSPPHHEIVARLQALEIDPVPDLVARIAALHAAEAAWFWPQIEKWGQGKPWRYAWETVDTAIRVTAVPPPRPETPQDGTTGLHRLRRAATAAMRSWRDTPAADVPAAGSGGAPDQPASQLPTSAPPAGRVVRAIALGVRVAVRELRGNR